MRISIGNGGWVAVDDLGLPGPRYVRVREQGGRLRVAEFYLDASQGGEAIDARDLRELPFTQLEAFINMCVDASSPRLGTLAPDLSTLATHFASGFGQVGKQIAAGNWVVASFVAQRLGRDGVKRAVVRGDEYLSGEDADRALAEDPSLPWVQDVRRGARPKDWRGLRESEREFCLTSGPTEGLTDDFLQALAKAYRAAVARGERPNVAIQEQTGYPLKTVQRWVYTARQRGIMPKGSKGKVG
jgi:hypothetical protein